MNIKCDAISQNHEFCISKTPVKQLFEDYDIQICFKKGTVLPYKNAKLMPEKSAKHKVAILIVSKPKTVQLGELNTINCPLLNFYSIDKRYLTEKLKEQFAEEILPMLFNQYNHHRDDEVNGYNYSMEVCIFNGKFEIKEK